MMAFIYKWLKNAVFRRDSIQHRQMLTKDNFFNEYILSQGTMYQWAAGTQAAARDPLQHLLPLILTDGEKAKSILRYTMKELAPPAARNASQPNNLPYGLIGHGALMTAVNRHDGTISQVRKHDPFICPRFDITMNGDFYHDRLGTNILNALKNKDRSQSSDEELYMFYAATEYLLRPMHILSCL